MFMAMIPTYVLEYTDTQGRASWRVSGIDNLKIFMDILIFNGVDDFIITKEKM